MASLPTSPRSTTATGVPSAAAKACRAPHCWVDPSSAFTSSGSAARSYSATGSSRADSAPSTSSSNRQLTAKRRSGSNSRQVSRKRATWLEAPKRTPRLGATPESVRVIRPSTAAVSAGTSAYGVAPTTFIPTSGTSALTSRSTNPATRSSTASAVGWRAARSRSETRWWTLPGPSPTSRG